jgi:CRP-like cAMP-binding protein
VKVSGLFRNSEGVRTFQAGETIFAQGDEGDLMYGVVEGEVDLVIDGRLVATCGPDDTFGEMAIIDHHPRTATAVARTDCRLASVDRRKFLFLVHETPTFALQVMSTMCERIRAEDRHRVQG